MKIAPFVLGLAATAAVAAVPESIAIDDAGVFPESLAASANGTVYVGNYAKGAIYRARPGGTTATPWIDVTAQSGRVMGLLVDASRKLLWACTYAKAAPGAPAVSSIDTFDLATGAPRQRYAFMGNGCNDLAIARDGMVYATDFSGGRVLRLGKGDSAFQPWAADPALVAADGIAVLADGSLIVNSFSAGTLLRVAIGADGAAGAITTLTLSRPLVHPDGMRAIGGNRLLLAEGEGRIDEVSIVGDAAEVRPVRENIPYGPSGVAFAKGKAFVSTANFAAMRQPGADAARSAVVVVPYTPVRASR